MRYLLGTVLLLVGLVLVAAKAKLGAAVTRSNRAATGRYKAEGWKAYDCFVYVVVGLFFAGFGLANLFGVID